MKKKNRNKQLKISSERHFLRQTPEGSLFEERIKEEGISIAYPHIENIAAEHFNEFCRRIAEAFYYFSLKCFKELKLLSFHLEINNDLVLLVWRGYIGPADDFMPEEFERISFCLPSWRILVKNEVKKQSRA